MLKHKHTVSEVDQYKYYLQDLHVHSLRSERKHLLGLWMVTPLSIERLLLIGLALTHFFKK